MANGSKQDMEGLGQAAKKMKDNGAVQQLLRSADTRRMMELLGSQETVRGAAKAAATGDTAKLVGMMQKLMNDPEGARLVERITKQAEESGL